MRENELGAQPSSKRGGIGDGGTRIEGTEHDGPGERTGQAVAPNARPAAKDIAIVRIAREIRRRVNRWRHGAAVDAFAAERTQVLAT